MQYECEECGALYTYPLDQVKLMKGLYCDICDTNYPIPNIKISSGKSTVNNIIDGDVSIVKNLLKQQKYTSDEIDSMLNAALSEGNYNTPEELFKSALCHYDPTV